MSKQNSIQHAGSPEVATPIRVPWAAVATFIAISFVLAWAIALPAWMIDKDRPGYQALFTVLASVMMFAPAIATLVVMLLLKVPMRGNRLRLLGVWPLRPAKRVVWFTVAAVVAPLLLTLASLGVAAAFGWLTLDLVHFSGFQQTLDGQLATLDPATAEAAKASLPPLGLLVGLQLLAIPFGAVFNSIFAFGEEIGWRGWLLPALRPLGTWPALLLSGVIWGAVARATYFARLQLQPHRLQRGPAHGRRLCRLGRAIWLGAPAHRVCVARGGWSRRVERFGRPVLGGWRGRGAV